MPTAPMEEVSSRTGEGEMNSQHMNMHAVVLDHDGWFIGGRRPLELHPTSAAAVAVEFLRPLLPRRAEGDPGSRQTSGLSRTCRPRWSPGPRPACCWRSSRGSDKRQGVKGGGQMRRESATT